MKKIIESKKGGELNKAGVFDEFYFEILLRHEAREVGEEEVACFIRILSVMNSTYASL